MKVLIAGGGIGGLAAALSLHAAGIEAEMFEQVPEVRELGVGINTLPHAIRELAALGLLPALDRAGIRTRELVYANRFGQTVWRELRGTDAGYDMPQFSIHRGKLHGMLHQATLERLGPARINTGCRLASFAERGTEIVATFERRGDGERFEAAGDALVGADGIHSAVRAQLYPDEGPPTWSGIMLWRGATDWPVYQDGRTMVIAGGNAAKFVFYPIHHEPARPDRRLTNWAIMARIGNGSKPPPRREDWNRPGRLDEVLPFVRDHFRLGFVDPVALIEATGIFYEYPTCDRDPVPGWSFGRATLLGDAAHPMVPRGSNGAGQAIVDARALADSLAAAAEPIAALRAYEVQRREATADVVRANRTNPPDAILREIYLRTGDRPFADIDRVISRDELVAISNRYKRVAGYDHETLARRK